MKVNDPANMMNVNVVELSESNFAREVLDAPTPVLVEFWAGWSETSKALTPVLESVADDAVPPIKVGRVNIEHQESLAETYGVRCVPTLLIFNQGGLQDQMVGRVTEQEVREKLESLQ